MQIEDGAGIAIICTAAASMAGGMAIMWKSLERRHRSEIERLVSQWDDLVERVRELEREKSKRADIYADRLEKMVSSYEATTTSAAESISGLVRVIKQLAENVNAQTEAISSRFEKGKLPAPHPAADSDTGALERDPPTRTRSTREHG